jgi:DNA-binding helix-hairpin-helix protein with protein kinase domain
MHVAGLAHSDLSSNNVLVDPSSGQSIVIDCDSLVVPGLYPPDVLGTPGYIAPEVLATTKLQLTDPKRKLPCVSTDQHALAVLIYEYLLNRHPLKGQKFHSANSEEDDYLMLGPKALFVEHPTDRSNPSDSARVSYNALGPQLAALFEKTFIHGLHAPLQRAAAIEWESALVKAWDQLCPCANRNCTRQWFIVNETTKGRCPFCGHNQPGTIPIIKFRKEVRPGQWVQDGTLVVRENLAVCVWHVVDNVFPGELANRTPQGYCFFGGGRWQLMNQNMTSLTELSGSRVPCGQAVELADGVQLRLSQAPNGRIAEVQFVNR